jgi:hypothetical protein
LKMFWNSAQTTAMNGSVVAALQLPVNAPCGNNVLLEHHGSAA